VQVSGRESGCWTDVIQPTEAELHLITHEWGVPESFADYLGDVDERPRVERDGLWTMAVIRIPVRCGAQSPAPYITVPMGIISGNGLLLTLCYHMSELTADFAEHTRRRGITVPSPSSMVLRMVFASAYWYLHYLQTINRAVSGSGELYSSSVSNDDLLRLTRMQRTLVYFNTSIRGNETLLERLAKAYPDTPVDEDLSEDVGIELRQADNTVSVYSDILSGLLETLASVISNNVNAVMKRMTSLSLVLMVPTLIASLYGMNVTLGISDSPDAFWYILGGSAILTAAVYLYLRRIHWF